MTLDEFQGVNAGYALELYERYRRDPGSVDAATRTAFSRWTPEPPGAAPAAPLGKTAGDPSLLLETHATPEDDLRRLPGSLVGGPGPESSPSAFETIDKLRRIYCGTTGFDMAQIFVADERDWLRDAAESGRYLPPVNPEIVLKHFYNIGMGVGADGGVVVLVLHDADQMAFSDIELAIRDYADTGCRGLADSRRPQGRHLHDHQRRRLRVAPEHADPQPAAGRHPRTACHPGPGRAGGRPSGDDVRRAQLRPPHRGWARGGTVPSGHQGVRRGPRPPAAGELIL